MHTTKILAKKFITHDVIELILEKPDNFSFIAGQATDVAVNLPEWKEKKIHLTFSGLADDKVLSFTMKVYKEHHRVTEKISTLSVGDELLISDPWGTIKYKGQGVFIAAGAGITPFLAIFRDLAKENQLSENILLYSNKTDDDIIHEKELKNYFQNKAHFFITRQENTTHNKGRINKETLKKFFTNENQKAYICGPRQFVIETKLRLDSLGVKPEDVVIEL
jgi:ferredoxin-NADP reductase